MLVTLQDQRASVLRGREDWLVLEARNTCYEVLGVSWCRAWERARTGGAVRTLLSVWMRLPSAYWVPAY